MKNNFVQKEKAIRDKLQSFDVTFLEVKIARKNALIVFIKNLTDINLLGELIIKPLVNFKGKVSENSVMKVLYSPDKKTAEDVSEIIDGITSGKTALIIDGIKNGILFELVKFDKRAISEPPTSAVIKGPREGFVESVEVNTSMIRRRIQSDKLVIKSFTVGNYSKTKISLFYVKGITDETLVNKITEKINSIDIDAVLDSSYISKFLNEHKKSLFKQVGNTEKPDVLTAKILEGRVALIVDGSPIALTVPYVLWEDFQSPSDYYNSPYSATFIRILRLFSVGISIMLPAFFVASELFHLQFIPLSFLLTIVNSIKGIPLSPSYEMVYTLLIFEILNEASVRMPKYVGMVVSIVGGLVLGETAVNAGIISAPALMIIAFSGICLFTVPELVQTFSLLRFLFLLVGGSVGGYGLLLASAYLIIYLVSFESHGVPLFAPFSPLITKDLKDGITKGFILSDDRKPLFLSKRSKEK